ncbi:nucleolar protein dao-5 [Aplysia californica]|uniref:Nucleolar protein dao-5 n=1 Tax=Aplysia californica TaxID=6500 RepID=A0ABM1VUL8_APLCA|nr:nucleolar protein dao-5 [Aplysia californica]
MQKCLDETSCGSLCQHPSCWASQQRQEKGIPRVLPPIQLDSDSSDDEICLPTQSVCNLLSEYGDSGSDRYPLSTGGRPSHQWDTPLHSATRSVKSLDTGLKLGVPHNTKTSLPRTRGFHKRNPRLRLVEVQEVFDREDLAGQWEETFVTRPYYVWMPNPHQSKLSHRARGSLGKTNHPVLMKDLTSTMVPPEVEHQREETVLFDEFPVLKKRQLRSKSPPMKPLHYLKAPQGTTSADISIDSEGINELLSLPRETLLKVLERTKRSDFTSKGKLHRIVQECVARDERAQMALSARELLQQRPMQLHTEQTQSSFHLSQGQPVFQLDEAAAHQPQTPPQSTGAPSDIESLDDFPNRRRPLIPLSGGRDMYNSADLAPYHRFKLPAISLGLPELPSGVKTTRPFSYKRQDLDFSLGPVISAPSSHRSSISEGYSENGTTTIKVNLSSTGPRTQLDEIAIHCVSPALSTHVPMAPAGTPANFQSPTKSAPQLREFKDMSRDPTYLTVNTSEKAQPPSREHREDTLLSSPGRAVRANTLSPLDAQRPVTSEEQGLDTIRETARENQDDSAASSHPPVTDRPLLSPVAHSPRSHTAQVHSPQPPSPSAAANQRDGQRPQLKLEASTLRSIDTAASARVSSAHSVESCPSPEQWPLISEKSSELLFARPSVSEPGLSARSDRRKPGRGKEEGLGRDYARKVLDEKRKAESPAPPPPSPEPKDPAERVEQRARRDLKSRDSLSMAPLMEVSEMEESSPVRALDSRGRDHGEGGRQETTRRIHVTVPMEHSDEKDRQTERKAEEEEGEVVSQVTVLHVAPKGRKGEGASEKVQETFLSVDIPAEELSSVQAEHGSSKQDDLSSGNQNSQSGASATAGSPTPRAHGSEVKGGEEDEEEKEQTQLGEDEETGMQIERDGYRRGEQDEQGEADGTLSARFQLKEMGNEEDSEYKKADRESLDSDMSPELLCDSARFISHDTVSPVEGENDEGREDLVRLPLVEEQESTSFPPGETESKDEGQAGNEEDKSQIQDDGENGKGNNNEEEESPDLQAPGSFFFAKSSSEEDLAQKDEETGVVVNEGEGEDTPAVESKEQKDMEQQNRSVEGRENTESESDSPQEKVQAPQTKGAPGDGGSSDQVTSELVGDIDTTEVAAEVRKVDTQSPADVTVQESVSDVAGEDDSSEMVAEEKDNDATAEIDQAATAPLGEGGEETQRKIGNNVAVDEEGGGDAVPGKDESSREEGKDASEVKEQHASSVGRDGDVADGGEGQAEVCGKDEGDEVPEEEGGNVSKEEGGNVSKEEGDEVPEEEGDEVPEEEGGNVSKVEGGNVSKEEGGNVSKEEGGNVSKEEGGEVPKDEGEVNADVEAPENSAPPKHEQSDELNEKGDVNADEKEDVLNEDKKDMEETEEKGMTDIVQGD